MDDLPPSGEDGEAGGGSTIDLLLRALLVGDVKLTLDPATGRVVATDRAAPGAGDPESPPAEMTS